MPRTLVALTPILFATALTACGSPLDGRPDSDTQGDGSSALDIATHDDAADAMRDATLPPPDGADASTTRDASVQGATPPAGYAQCGGASFTAMDVQTACASLPSIPGSLPYATNCAAATTHGGRYEVWCSPVTDGLYVWVEFDSVQVQGTTCILTLDDGFSAPLTIYPMPGSTRYVLSTGARGGAGDLSGHAVGSITGAPMNLIVDGTVSFGGMGGPSGAINLWVSMQEDGCPTVHGPPPMRPPPYYAIGVAAVWGTADH